MGRARHVCQIIEQDSVSPNMELLTQEQVRIVLTQAICNMSATKKSDDFHPPSQQMLLKDCYLQEKFHTNWFC